MKVSKSLIVYAIGMLAILPVGAQLKIEKGGYAVFGKNTGSTRYNNTLGTTQVIPTPVDTLAAATFLGHDLYY